LYAKKDKKKKKDNKKKIPILAAFFAFYPIITILASRLLIINSKITVINTSKKVNLRCPDKFWLKILIRKKRCFICKK